MRIVVCDEDALTLDLTEALVARLGHEVAGVADTTAAAIGLIQSARPDAVILDLSLGYNTDFDVVDATLAVGARPIVFSRQAEAGLLERYAERPVMVLKPDFDALEQVLSRLGRDDEQGPVIEQDRRRHPARTPSGPEPTGVGDAQAFFEAIQDAQPGDAFVSVDVARGAESVAEQLRRVVRGTDRVLAFPTTVRLFLTGAGDDGRRPLLERVAQMAPAGARIASVLVGPGEHGADAFERLKHHGEEWPAALSGG